MNADDIFAALRVAGTCIVFACFIFIPLKSRFRYGNVRTALWVSALIVVTVVTTLLFLLPGHLFTEYNILGIALWFCLAVAVFRITIESSGFELLFIVLVTLNLYVNIMAITKSIVSLHLKEMPEAAAQMLVSYGVTLFYVPLLWILLVRFFRRIVELNISRSFWRVIWMIPALTYIVFYVKIVGDFWKRPVHIEKGDVLFSVLWSFITYAFFFVTLVMLLQAYKGIAAMEETKLIASQLQMQEEKYESMIEHMEDTARLRHDWRHHLLVIAGFADSGSVEGLREYLKQLAPVYMADTDTTLCENHVADVILRHYRTLADDAGIKIRIQADIPEGIHIGETDLGSVLGNLLENALHACRGRQTGEREIEVKAAVKGSQLVIMLRNTYENKIVERKGRYLSTKHEGEGRGIASVKRVVEKYRGMVHVAYDERFFNITLFMNLEEQKRSAPGSREQYL